MATPSLADLSRLLDGAPSNGRGDVVRPGSRNAAPAPAPAATASQAIRTAFQRFELKYWITEPLAQRVLAFALPYLKRDAHAIRRDDQRNTTLYLDTRGFQFCENHLNLSPDRSKLRVRAYGRPFGKLAFFEVKRKVKTITLKERFALPIGEVENVLSRRPIQCDISEAARRTLGDFVFQMCLHRAAPKLFVCCFREAFESRIPGEDVRLTLDRDLMYQPAEGFGFSPVEGRYVPIHEGDDSRTSHGSRRVMLELKFNGTPPRWMTELVRHFNLQREAFSKYTTAALQLRGRM
jgi:SPX domain protein involved in polyphosphate accumulation